MILFLRNIPSTTRYDDIFRFVEPGLKGGLLRKSGRIERVQMLVIKDTNKKSLEFHGLVRVEPDTIGERAIAKLSRKPFLGQAIEVREYRHRSWHNDRRVYKLPNNYVLLCERRSDRRRRDVEKQIVDPDLNGKFKYSFL